MLFVIPWRNHWIVGTTDTDWNLDLAHPAATKADIDYILEHVNSVLATPLTHDDIEGVYAGLRPLLAGESESTSKLSREHAVARVAPGLVAIAGGKYTTYRVMGADAVDAAAVDLPGRIQPSITDKVPLVGADGYHALVNQADQLAPRTGCTRTGSGTCSTATARWCTRCWRWRRTTGAAQADARRAGLPAGRGRLRGDARGRAAPRGRAGPADPDLHRVRAPGRGVAEPVARLMRRGARVGRRAVEREVAVYTARVEAERTSQAEPDDQAADAVRSPRPRPDRRSSNR